MRKWISYFKNYSTENQKKQLLKKFKIKLEEDQIETNEKAKDSKPEESKVQQPERVIEGIERDVNDMLASEPQGVPELLEYWKMLKPLTIETLEKFW